MRFLKDTCCCRCLVKDVLPPPALLVLLLSAALTAVVVLVTLFVVGSDLNFEVDLSHRRVSLSTSALTAGFVGVCGALFFFSVLENDDAVEFVVGMGSSLGFWSFGGGGGGVGFTCL